MNAATLDALRASIAHWERLAGGARNETIGPQGCALCRLFYYERCDGCPVREATRRTLCCASPYEMAEDCFFRRDNSAEAWARWIAAAKAELDFLKNLLPKNKTT